VLPIPLIVNTRTYVISVKCIDGGLHRVLMFRQVMVNLIITAKPRSQLVCISSATHAEFVWPGPLIQITWVAYIAIDVSLHGFDSIPITVLRKPFVTVKLGKAIGHPRREYT